MIKLHFFEGVLNWAVFKSLFLQLMGKIFAGILYSLFISLSLSIKVEWSINWNQFWELLPYVGLGVILIGMIKVEGREENHLSLFIIFLLGIILVPTEIYLNGLNAALKYAKYGLAFGGGFSALLLMGFVVRPGGSVSHQFTIDWFIRLFILCVLTTLAGICGHAIFTLLKFFR